jgi:CRP-like cAMP-binding protein
MEIEDSRFLSALPRQGAGMLLASARPRTGDRRRYALRQGDLADGISWLQWGIVHIFFENADGSTLPYLTCWPHEMGCSGLVGVAESAASCIGLTPFTYYVVPGEDARRVVREVSGMGDALLSYLCRQLHRRAAWQGMLCSLRVPDRVRLAVARMAVELGTDEGEQHLLDVSVTTQTLRVITYVSRDDVGRVLRELEEQGIIGRIAGRKMMVPDFDRLLGDDLRPLLARLGQLGNDAGRR